MNSDNVENSISEQELYHRGAWQCIAGSAHVARLIDYFGSAESAWQAGDDEISQVSGFDKSAGRKILKARLMKRDYPAELREMCQLKNISLCTVESPEYPELLRHIFNPPAVLFYRGKLESTAKRIAMVGSRKVTAYGQAVAESVSAELAAKRIRIVSGGAVGVDTCSHRGAMTRGITEAVLGCGVDVAYPAQNEKLLAEIAEKGAVISEYAPGTPPRRDFFPARNRIISGMSRGTVVVEATERSGSLITADLAVSEGRDVFAVPGSVFSLSSRGCNRLIQQGAKLVTGAGDIIGEYEDWEKDGKQALARSVRSAGSQQMNLFAQSSDLDLQTTEEQQIYRLLTPDIPLNIDDVIYRLQGGNPADISVHLLQMELKGLVRRNSFGGYTLKVSSQK